jgi:hypothetical protein
MTEIHDYADHDEDDLKRKSSRPSPEEGHRGAVGTPRLRTRMQGAKAMLEAADHS